MAKVNSFHTRNSQRTTEVNILYKKYLTIRYFASFLLPFLYTYVFVKAHSALGKTSCYELIGIANPQNIL